MKALFFRFLILISCLLFSIQTYAEDFYYVIHVKGIVSNQKTGKVLKIGDQISINDQIKFGSADALAVVMGANGKFTLAPATGKKNDSEFIAYVKQAILPIKSNGHLSTRGTDTENIVDLKGYFGTGKFAIIGEKLSIKIEAAKYPLTETKIFTYSYLFNGKTVNKKIFHNGNEITIDKNALYTVDGIPVDPDKIPNVDIYYCDTKTKSYTKIVNFSALFISEDLLKEEVKVQETILIEKKLTKDQIEKELLSFISDVYGKTDEVFFFNWIKTKDK